MSRIPGITTNCSPCMWGHAHARTPYSNCIVPGRHAARVRPDEGLSSGRPDHPLRPPVQHRSERSAR